MKRTPLFSAHRRAGAKLVEFAGWEMPVLYRGVIEEHRAVRRAAGLFDVSHMGEVAVRGKGALEFCQYLTANDLGRMRVGQAQYNLLLNQAGGVIDDVIFYRIGEDDFFICVNAANTDKDFMWLKDRAAAGLAIENVSDRYAQVALQGPRAEAILQTLTATALSELKSFHFVFAEVAALRCLTARTGYTGEDGFELYCEAEKGLQLWNALLEAGAKQELVPAGLGARDTLRLEKGYPLYGHELDDGTTPLEAGLEWVTKFSKTDFMGRDVLLKQKERGVERKLVGLELLEPGIARAGYQLFKDDRPIGRVTSGTRSPSLDKSIALGYVAVQHSAIGALAAVEIRGRKVPAAIVSIPFYRR